jgi:hypothetical protein
VNPWGTISAYLQDILTAIKMFLGYHLHPFRTAVCFSIFMGCQVRERDEVSETMDSCSKLTHLVALEDFISTFSVTVIYSSHKQHLLSLFKG